VKDSWKDEGDEDEITCQVQFDDKTWAEIPLSKLYRCELQEGDKIMVPGVKGKPLAREGHVSAVPLWEERSRVSVRLQLIPKEEVRIFEGKKIGVTAAYVRKEWRDRRAINLEDIGLGEELIRVQEERQRKEAAAKAIGRTIPSAAFLGPPRWKDSPPPPPRLSSLSSRGQKRLPQAIDEVATSTTSKRRRLEAPPTTTMSSRKPLSNHLIMLALAINDDKGNRLEKAQRGAHKEELIAAIERLGGKVVSGFEELLQWGGKISDDGSRWVWKSGDITYTEESSAVAGTIKRAKRVTEPPKLFLVADGPNRTAKYLMALAAGIPCVDKGWIRDEVSLSYILFNPLVSKYYLRMSPRGMRTFFLPANLQVWATHAPNGSTIRIRPALALSRLCLMNRVRCTKHSTTRRFYFCTHQSLRTRCVGIILFPCSPTQLFSRLKRTDSPTPTPTRLSHA
jgi:hypothetical protein